MTTPNKFLQRLSAAALAASAGLAIVCTPIQAQAQPQATGQQPATPETDQDELIQLPSFPEPVEIRALIDFTQAVLGINIAAQGEPAGEIILNAPIEIPKSDLIRFLDTMLARLDYSIQYDPETDFYIIQEVGNVDPQFGGDLATIKLIQTPNIKPSLLSAGIAQVAGGPESGLTVEAIDQYGVLILSGSPRSIRLAERVVDEILKTRANQSYHRIELTHIAAPVARERVLSYSGGAQQTQRVPGNAAGNSAFGSSSFNSFGDRLTVDAQGNAMLFRGTQAELEDVLNLIDLIDVQNTLTARQYFAGSSAQQIADIARSRGLGEVNVLEAGQTDFDRQQQRAFQNQQFNAEGGLVGNSSTGSTGGPVMVVDVERGSIIYYGTESQQQQLETIIDEIGTEDERVVIRDYALKHGQAEEMADLLDAIITGTQRTGDSALLPETRIAGSQSTVRRDVVPRRDSNGEVALTDGSGNDVSGDFDPDEVIVVPDVPNNQILVRAPLRQQDELARLIDRLDQRRKQVYIDVLILSVTNTENFRLAVEAQILNGQYGIQSAFGLSSAGTDFQSQRSVSASLGGLTAALIQSESIPFIVNAVQTDTDAQIMSRPTLLVNDNEEASIDSVEEQPTTSQSQTETSLLTSFQGFEEAGTNLVVTPTISDGGYLRLEYEVTLSAFTGAGSDGIPAPRSTNSVNSVVTVPSDATIVVGGIRASNLTDTVEKVPILGDIPLLGLLFQDRNKIKTDSVLYVFITPRIMSDPNFRDVKLMTKGPQAEVNATVEERPPLQPILIEPASIAPRARPTIPSPQPEETPTGEIAFTREGDAQ